LIFHAIIEKRGRGEEFAVTAVDPLQIAVLGTDHERLDGLHQRIVCQDGFTLSDPSRLSNATSPRAWFAPGA
jgi:hypothetical protein